MALTLAQFEARIGVALIDAGAAIYVAATIDENLRQALHEYSKVLPLVTDTVVVCPAAGREIALNNLTGLLNVVDVQWPYDSAATSETWPPYRPRGFSLVWDDARPVLVLTAEDGDQPQTDDEVRVFYTSLQTIQNLDSASVTTVRPDHESLLVRGAAGLCCYSRAIDLSEMISPNKWAVTHLQNLGDRFLYGRDGLLGFYPELERIKHNSTAAAPAFASGWPLDKWDRP
jgi:hypothetical protein